MNYNIYMCEMETVLFIAGVIWLLLGCSIFLVIFKFKKKEESVKILDLVQGIFLIGLGLAGVAMKFYYNSLC